MGIFQVFRTLPLHIMQYILLCKAAYITHELLHDYLSKCSTCRVYNIIIIRHTVLRIMDVIILHAML